MFAKSENANPQDHTETQFQPGFAPFLFGKATRATMLGTTWTDFSTGEHGFIYHCYGHHADGFVDDTNSWRPTTTCPFHSITTFPLSTVSIHNTLLQQQIRRKMATTTVFTGNEAMSLIPLRQQIIGE